ADVTRAFERVRGYDLERLSQEPYALLKVFGGAREAVTSVKKIRETRERSRARWRIARVQLKSVPRELDPLVDRLEESGMLVHGAQHRGHVMQQRGPGGGI